MPVRVWGLFQPRELRVYLVGMSIVFWGLIGLAWLSYPSENQYSIWTHTFSFLGSWEDKHNPAYWWIFSVAMMFWAVASVPPVLHARRCFATISPVGAWIGAVLFLLGCIGIAGVALFPDARDELFGATRWTEVHEKAAVLVALGFTLGILWHGLLLLVDRIRRHASVRHFKHERFIWPYLLWAAMVGIAGYNQASWAGIYEARKAEAAAAGTSIGSSWAESINTIYAFPLWENLIIYTLYAFIVWFMLSLPCVGAPATGATRT